LFYTRFCRAGLLPALQFILKMCEDYHHEDSCQET
jgi:hypothetical protein